jgi:hypothetical protein
MPRKPKVQRTPEEKWQIVLEGLKSGNVAETCRKYEIAPTLYYRWKESSSPCRRECCAGFTEQESFYGFLLRASAETPPGVARSPALSERSGASSGTPYLEPETSTPLPCAPCCLRRRPEVHLRARSATPCRRTRATHSSQVLRCLASALPQRLDRLLQTTLRRTRVRPTVSRPLFPPRRISNHRLVAWADRQVSFRRRTVSVRAFPYVFSAVLLQGLDSRMFLREHAPSHDSSSLHSPVKSMSSKSACSVSSGLYLRFASKSWRLWSLPVAPLA